MLKINIWLRPRAGLLIGVEPASLVVTADAVAKVRLVGVGGAEVTTEADLLLMEVDEIAFVFAQPQSTLQFGGRLDNLRTPLSRWHCHSDSEPGSTAKATWCNRLTAPSISTIWSWSRPSQRTTTVLSRSAVRSPKAL